MIPTLEQTFMAVGNAVAKAEQNPQLFGQTIMETGMKHEESLSRDLADALRCMGFVAKPEEPDGVGGKRGGKIDVLVDSPGTGSQCMIELKLYYCYDIANRRPRHAHIWNTYADFMKRMHLHRAATKQQVVLFGNYVHVDDADWRIHSFKASRKSAGDRPLAERLRIFADDLYAEFGRCCDVFPSTNAREATALLASPKYGHGSQMNIHGWVLGLRPDVTFAKLDGRLEKRATRSWYEKCREKAWYRRHESSTQSVGSVHATGLK